MKLFELDFAKTVLRYYLMMAVIIIAGFTGQWWLAGFGFFIFLSAFMGISFKRETEKAASAAKVIKMEPSSKEIKEAV